MKKAAELGIVEAQHNLGCMYIENKVTEYNSIKALAWFTQAASAGFLHSMVFFLYIYIYFPKSYKKKYNAAKMYLEGSEDGKIKINLKAGLIWLENIKKTE